MNLTRALSIAVWAHDGQLDKAGAPYILHPLRVMQKFYDPVLQQIAVLHDVIEDCPYWSIERLTTQGFDPLVVNAVDVLTRRINENYDDYIERVAKNPLAKKVKIADLKDNLNLGRLMKIERADRLKLEAKYFKALNQLGN